jgi:phosphoribosylanthranilate isomerase
MFRIKICGITNVEDAVAAVDAGADAIGLNFYTKSCRFVEQTAATAIARAVSDAGQLPVGVFVNHLPREVSRIATAVGLTICQLHGDETPAIAKAIEDLGRDVIRVQRLAPDADVFGLQRDLVRYIEGTGSAPRAYLVDAASDGYGGAGIPAPWQTLADYRKAIGPVPLILAGGLTPENVAEAIRIVRPYGVDVASGVESAPGKKDPAKVRDFVAAASAAFDLIAG